MQPIVVDIEANGPIPGVYSMLSIGAVMLNNLDRTFYTSIRPIAGAKVDPGAMAHCGFTLDEVANFTVTPKLSMEMFAGWLELNCKGERPLFISDNAGFDWMFVAWYFHAFIGRNPFGFSPMSITSLYKGFAKTTKASFKHLRTVQHDHNALNDALGNAGALLKMRELGMRGLY